MTTQEEFAACERSDRRLCILLGETMVQGVGRFGLLLAIAIVAAIVLTGLS